VFGPIRAAKAWAAGNTRSVSGITGNLLGLALLIGPALVNDDPTCELLETPGIVSGVLESHHPDGEVLYGAIYTYEVDRQSFEIRSSSRASTRPVLGTEVTIGYPEADPAGGRRVDGIEGNLVLILQGIGALAALVALAISVTLLVVGLKLFRDGRRGLSEAGSSDGVLAELIRIVRTTERATLNVTETAAGIAGSPQGSPDPPRARA
jgi:hypothetical protein